MSKDLLKEAIADAKAVRSTAIANAKLAPQYFQLDAPRTRIRGQNAIVSKIHFPKLRQKDYGRCISVIKII